MRDFEAWHAWLQSMQAEPFAWGSNDCVTFAAGAVRALTGADPLKDIAKWTDERSALRALARVGGINAAVSAVLTEIPIAHAHRGDVGAIEGERGPLLVVIEGVTVAAPGPNGIERLNRDRLAKAWSAE